MAEDVLLESVQGYVGTLTLNRPERRNALTPEMLVKIHTTLETWAKEDTVRCVVISGGDGKAFCSGFDITGIPTDVSPEMEKLIKEHNPLELAFSSLKNFPYPTIAMWNGYCYGAGLNLSVCCDIRIAADDVKVGMPPAKLGLVYHIEGLMQFVEAVGMAATRKLFLTARTFSAHEAFDMGLVSHLAPREDLLTFTYGLADETSTNAPLSLKGIKRILNMLESAAVLSDKDRAEAEQLQAQAFASEDLKEGQTAFLEKRAPVFKGR